MQESNDGWNHAVEYFKDYQKVNPEWQSKGVVDAFNLERDNERISCIENDLNIELTNCNILEVGSGVGSFLIVAKTKGICCYGIEPNIVGVKTSVIRDDTLKNKVVIGIGEKLPYKDENFDMVVSFQVLEHTQKPEQVLKESIRVLKNGGYLYFVIPNYNSFWEGHYGLYWLPRFPKTLAKIYLKLLGRDPKFLDSIQYITPKFISSVLADENVEILSIGIETWKKRLTSLEFSTYGSTKKLLNIVHLIHKIRLVSLIKYISIKFDMYYPIILIARKTR